MVESEKNVIIYPVDSQVIVKVYNFLIKYLRNSTIMYTVIIYGSKHTLFIVGNDATWWYS